MEIYYRILLVMALCLIWLAFYFLVPLARDKELRRYHVLLILGLVFMYLALSDPLGLTENLYILGQALTLR